MIGQRVQLGPNHPARHDPIGPASHARTVGPGRTGRPPKPAGLKPSEITYPDNYQPHYSLKQLLQLYADEHQRRKVTGGWCPCPPCRDLRWHAQQATAKRRATS